MVFRLSNLAFWAGGPGIVVGLAGAIALVSPPPGPEIGGVPPRLPAPDVVEAAGTGTTAARPKASEGGATTGSPAAAVTPEAGETPNAEGADIQVGGRDPAVDTPEGGDRLALATDPAAPVVVETDPGAKPEVAVPDGPAKRVGPRFDLVRVDKFGSAVIAGKAEPGQIVEISLDGAVVAEAVADARGAFVVLFDLPGSEVPQVLTLAARGEDGDLIRSTDRVFVMGREVSAETVAEAEQPAAPETPDAAADAKAADLPTDTPRETATAEPPQAPPAKDEPATPAVILATEDGVRVIQPPAAEDEAPEVMANVTLDLISYDDQGEVVLTGRSKTDRHVRVYVDNKPVKTQSVAEDGSWQLSLPEVDAGRYTLRVDEIDDKGQVTSRLETPFQKEEPDRVKRATASLETPETDAAPKMQKVTIQKGATLWELAESRYGEGLRYWQIFHANRDQIRNPNLIYPGQIFTIPE